MSLVYFHFTKCNVFKINVWIILVFIFIILINFNNLKQKQKWSITLLGIKDSKVMGKS